MTLNTIYKINTTLISVRFTSTYIYFEIHQNKAHTVIQMYLYF